MKKFYSNGKLLLTGEYVVLDGARALAVPTKYGQSLTIEETNTGKIEWQSLDYKGKVWFESKFEFTLSNKTTLFFSPLEVRSLGARNNSDTAKTLTDLLNQALRLNSAFLTDSKGVKVNTKLDFPRDWGLGSSSTLINNIAQWAQIDAFELLWGAFGGSGYDIACARHNSPIIYQLENRTPRVEPVNFDPQFKGQLYFVHLNQKQNSREGIARYRNFKGSIRPTIKEIDQLTKQLIKSTSLSEFEAIIDHHENSIADVIKLPTVKEQLFSDYFGSIKSLGAWGGDFVLATGNEHTATYFKKKGFETVIPYAEMVL